MQRGVYEQLLSAGLQKRLAELDGRQWRIATADVDGAEQAAVLSDHFARVLCRVLEAAHATGGADEATRLHNALLDQLHQASQDDSLAGGSVEPPARQLRLVWPHDQADPGRPDSPLITGTLLTGTRLDPSLVSQLRKELQTADQVDILCSFIKWGGIRVLEDDLRQFTGRDGARLRIITTS